MENDTLASELLHELKASTRRWFIIAMAELVVIAILIFVMFFVPVEEYSTEYDQQADNGSYNQIVGGDYGGTADSENELQEETRSRSTEAP